MDNAGIIAQYAGAIAGAIALGWRLFEAYAASSSAKWDDKVVNLINGTVAPIVDALEKNTAATNSNSDHVAANTNVTSDNTVATAAGTKS